MVRRGAGESAAQRFPGAASRSVLPEAAALALGEFGPEAGPVVPVVLPELAAATESVSVLPEASPSAASSDRWGACGEWPGRWAEYRWVVPARGLAARRWTRSSSLIRSARLVF